MAERFEAMLAGSAVQQGWSVDSEVGVLLEFLEEQATLHPGLRAEFQGYLDMRVDEENEAEPVDDE